MSIDEFLSDVRMEIEARLNARAPSEGRPLSIVVVADAAGVVSVEPVEGHLAAHELLDSFLASGASAAAHVTFPRNSKDEVIAQALVDSPRDSDVRVACIEQDSDGVETLGSWRYVV